MHAVGVEIVPNTVTDHSWQYVTEIDRIDIGSGCQREHLRIAASGTEGGGRQWTRVDIDGIGARQQVRELVEPVVGGSRRAGGVAGARDRDSEGIDSEFASLLGAVAIKVGINRVAEADRCGIPEVGRDVVLAKSERDVGRRVEATVDIKRLGHSCGNTRGHRNGVAIGVEVLEKVVSVDVSNGGYWRSQTASGQ